jgi:hypothetical protein
MHNAGDVRAHLPLQKLIWGKGVAGKFLVSCEMHHELLSVVVSMVHLKHAISSYTRSSVSLSYSRLECSVCGHSWFQSRDRLMTLGEGFEMKTLPEMDKNRIKINMEEGKSPKFMGEFKLYVGNIAFDSTEDDLYSVFSEVGTVGDIALVRDDMGRNRGFGFVTMRTKADGEKAMESLDGKELNGRNIAVRESNS